MVVVEEEVCIWDADSLQKPRGSFILYQRFKSTLIGISEVSAGKL